MMLDVVESCDRPADEIGEIEVTQEMSKAGSRIISDAYAEADDWLTQEIATEVYHAMHSALVGG